MIEKNQYVKFLVVKAKMSKETQIQVLRKEPEPELLHKSQEPLNTS